LAQHLDCSRTYIGKLEAEGVIQRQGDGFPLDLSRVAYLRCGASGTNHRALWLMRSVPCEGRIVRRPKVTPVHELERYKRYICCKDCSESCPFKRGHLVALQAARLSANDPPSTVAR
jgi:Fe-S oxidoreductase